MEIKKFLDLSTSGTSKFIVDFDNKTSENVHFSEIYVYTLITLIFIAL